MVLIILRSLSVASRRARCSLRSISITLTNPIPNPTLNLMPTLTLSPSPSLNPNPSHHPTLPCRAPALSNSKPTRMDRRIRGRFRIWMRTRRRLVSRRIWIILVLLRIWTTSVPPRSMRTRTAAVVSVMGTVTGRWARRRILLPLHHRPRRTISSIISINLTTNSTSISIRRSMVPVLGQHHRASSRSLWILGAGRHNSSSSSSWIMPRLRLHLRRSGLMLMHNPNPSPSPNLNLLV